MSGATNNLNDATGIGINIRRLGFDSGDELFADAMKEAGAWSLNFANPVSTTTQTTADPAPIDANGWPTTDAAIEAIGNVSDDGGTYALSFTGQATVAPVASESNILVVNQAYNASTNTTTANVILPVGANQLMLDFTNTRRLPTDTTATGVSNVELYRPNGVDSSTPYSPSTLFSTPILNLISNFSTIRYMDYSLTNNNPQVNWSDRTLPSQKQTDGIGGAWEYAVALANQTGKDMWINIPEMATTQYITNLAELIDYGSDGVNPYTGPIGSAVSTSNPNPVPASGPVWAGLNSNLHVYVEYSNEVWNYSFAQALQNIHGAVTEVAAGNSPLNYDGDENENDWAVRHTAELTVETSNIFRSVFGNSQMITRIRPVLQWQYGNLNNTAAVGLEFLNNYYNNADGLTHVSNPHPVSYYLWGGGGAWYGGLANPAGTGDVTVSDGNFASPSVSGYSADPTGGSWTFSGTSGIAANGSALGNPSSVSGSQAAYLQGTGSFSEVVNFTGGLADLSFSAAGNGTESFAVSVDGNDVSEPWNLTSAYTAENTNAFNTGISNGPHLVTFTGISGTGSVFISNIGADTANAMYKSALNNITATTQSESTWAAAFGLHDASYEGGFNFGTGVVGTPLQIAANVSDPRAEQDVITQTDEFFAAGGELGNFYDTTNHIWALTLDINNQSTPKLEGLKAVMASPLPTVNFGTIIPSTAGQSVSVPDMIGVNSGAAGLYGIRVSTPGTYHLVLNGSQSGAENEQFLLDGQLLPGLTMLGSTSGASSPSLTFTITTPGFHALLLTLNGSGSVSPGNPAGSLTITAGAGASLPAAPSAITKPAASASSMTQVNLSWTASAGAKGYRIERSTNGTNFYVIGSTTSTSYSDKLATPGVKYIYAVAPYNTGGYGKAVAFPVVTPPATYVPSPWKDADLGYPFYGGWANYSTSSKTWMVAGGGQDIFYHSDSGNFLSQTVSGNTTLVAEVTSVGYANSQSKAGIMFRASNTPYDLFIDLTVQAGGGLLLQYRPGVDMPAVTAASTSTSIKAPVWLRLVRSGNTFTASYSTNGSSWISVGSPIALALPTAALAGLAVSSHNNAQRSTSTFANVNV